MAAGSAMGREVRGASIGEETYFVFYSDQDSGNSAGVLIREGYERACKSEKLLYECGYNHVDVRHAASVGELILSE